MSESLVTRRLALVATALSILAGCATPTTTPPAPAMPVGPTATIGEHGSSGDGSKGWLFYIESIDGKPVESSFQATRRATRYKGTRLQMQWVDHTVPARPLRLKLVGTHITGAPITELMSRAAGTFHRVEGELIFTPEPGGSYFVTGKLQKEGSAVWIADVKTEQRISDMVLAAEASDPETIRTPIDKAAR